MPVSFKVVDNRTNVSKKIAELNQQLENYGRYFLEGMADQIIELSPVDTGTYMDSHQLSIGRLGGSTSSVGKARNQKIELHAEAARDRLYSQAAAIDVSNLNKISFTNTSEHAHLVEYESKTHLKEENKSKGAAYTTARNKANIIAQEAAQRAKGS